jgi:hypothetical protein
MTRSSVDAGPEGRRRPCSYCCTVSRVKPNRRANCAWVSPSLARRARTWSGDGGGYTGSASASQVDVGSPSETYNGNSKAQLTSEAGQAVYHRPTKVDTVKAGITSSFQRPQDHQRRRGHIRGHPIPGSTPPASSSTSTPAAPASRPAPSSPHRRPERGNIGKGVMCCAAHDGTGFRFISFSNVHMPQLYRVFVSLAARDRWIAERIADLLRARGARTSRRL